MPVGTRIVYRKSESSRKRLYGLYSWWYGLFLYLHHLVQSILGFKTTMIAMFNPPFCWIDRLEACSMPRFLRSLQHAAIFGNSARLPCGPLLPMHRDRHPPTAFCRSEDSEWACPHPVIGLLCRQLEQLSRRNWRDGLFLWEIFT